MEDLSKLRRRMLKIPPHKMASCDLYFTEQCKDHKKYEAIKPESDDTLQASLTNGIETSSAKVGNQEGMSETNFFFFLIGKC